MKITNSNVTLESQHVFSRQYSYTESLKVVDRPQDGSSDKSSGMGPAEKSWKDYIEISREALEKSRKELEGTDKVLTLDDLKDLEIPDKDKQKILLIARMIKAITGKDFRIILPRDIRSGNLVISLSGKNAHVNGIKEDKSSNNSWGAEFKSTETYVESESLSFSAKGMVNTSDGKQVQFDLNLNMTRKFAAQNSVDVKMGNTRLLDPLVINYDGPAANVKPEKISFDIDSDGKKEQISSLGKGSGFLALDINNDGKINDGSELFGTKSGNGFEDLSKYDSDHNGWIDENDVIFNKLRIWTVNDDGTKDLFSLGEKGVGAIYLGNVGAGYNYTDNNNALEAKSRNIGIFLSESGTAGTIQQVDFAV